VDVAIGGKRPIAMSARREIHSYDPHKPTALRASSSAPLLGPLARIEEMAFSYGAPESLGL